MFNVLKKICIFTCLISISFTMVGCDFENSEEKTIKNKTSEEMSYLENRILTILNKYAKNEYGNEDDLNWDAINENVIELNNVLDTIILDFSESEISNEDIIKFRDGVNNLIIATSQKDINLVIAQASELYSYLPNYLEKIGENNKNKVNIMKLKSFVITSFSYAKQLDWENAKQAIEMADNKYKEMTDDVDYMKEYSYNLNKVYILLGELKNVINVEELELTKMKYINFIEKIS